MNYKFILALDPSGNFTEGKGTTGWSLFNALDNKIIKADSISAKKFATQEEYWYKHMDLITDTSKKHKKQLVIVIEDYLLYASKAKDQINSRMETSKLIGILQLHCFTNGIPYIMQPASEVKKRWTNEILHYKGYIKLYKRKYTIPDTKVAIDRHCLDSIRHGVHYATFKNNKEETKCHHAKKNKNK